MPTYRIRVINGTIISSVESELPDLQEARNEALKGALQIGADEIHSGEKFFGAEIVIEEGEVVVDRSMLAIGHSPLKG